MRLTSSKRPHFIGIGGVGMCALAEILIHDGLAVSGCDAAPSERTERLAKLGALINIGHTADHIDDADLVVITAAVSEDNVELCAARERGIPVLRRSEALGQLMHGKVGIAVAGTHGKTTTTAMIGHLLEQCGVEPSVITGGRMHWAGGHSFVGGGEVVVCEADEFDRAFLDLYPTWAVVTNIEPEHLECYGSEDNLYSAFRQFASRVPSSGAVVLCRDDEGARRLEAAINRPVIGYGLSEDCDLRAVDVISDRQGISCTVVEDSSILGQLRVPLAGEHNLRNALAAVVIARCFGIDFERIASACLRFSGVARRFEVLGERDSVVIIDDYAHHPTEVESALCAARQFYPDRRLVAVFQPHLYSRTRDNAADFARVLARADVAVVLPVYAAREKVIDGINSALISEQIVSTIEVLLVDENDEAAFKLESIVREGDAVMTLGAGDVHRLAESFLGDRS